MKPPPFAYARAESVEHAVELLAADEDAKVLAGGMSLVPMLNFRLARPSTLVDVTHVPALAAIEREDGELVIGATVRQADAERSPLVERDCPLLVKAIRHIGHLQIRTRGTVGGSLAHCDPAAELGAAALALDATLVARGPSGERRIPAGEFFLGPYMSTLEETEVLVAARFPVLERARTGFAEYARRAGDFAEAAVAAVVIADPDGTVADARIAATAVGARPLRLSAAEQSLVGGPLTDETAGAAAGEATFDHVQPGSEAAVYKAELVRTLVGRALREAMA